MNDNNQNCDNGKHQFQHTNFSNTLSCAWCGFRFIVEDNQIEIIEDDGSID
jgi:hypothetical protein